MGEHKEEVAALIDRTLPWSRVHQMMSAYKSEGRFGAYRDALQSRVTWPDIIILPLTNKLYIVDKGAAGVVKCECGHEFGDYTENWKLSARVFVRRSKEDIQQIYGPFGCDPAWMEIREFVCPSCASLLEVEAATPGYPFLFDFLPDISAFYRDWLGEEPPGWAVAQA